MVQRVDMLIGVVLVVAVVVSAVGVATYEDDRLATFRVAWQETRVPLDEETATRQGAGSIEATLLVTGENLSRVELVLTIGGSGPRLQPVDVLVEVVPPAGLEPVQEEARLEVGPGGTIRVPVPIEVAAKPEDREVRASSPAAALDAASPANKTAGQGEWLVRVTFAPASPGPLSQGETFTLVAAGEAVGHRGTATPKTPEVGR